MAKIQYLLTGRQIRIARACLGLNQKELAAKSNISWATLKRIESHDDMAPMQLATANKLTTTLNNEMRAGKWQFYRGGVCRME